MAKKLRALCKVNLPGDLSIYNPGHPVETDKPHYRRVRYNEKSQTARQDAMSAALWYVLRDQGQGKAQLDTLKEFGVGRYVNILEVYDPAEKKRGKQKSSVQPLKEYQLPLFQAI